MRNTKMNTSVVILHPETSLCEELESKPQRTGVWPAANWEPVFPMDSWTRYQAQSVAGTRELPNLEDAVEILKGRVLV